MARETIKEYLVSLGFENDNSGLSEIKTALSGLKSVINEFGKILNDASGKTHAFVSSLTGQSDAAVGTSNAMREAANSAQAYGSELDSAGSNADRFSSNTDQAGRSAQAAGRKVEDAAKNVKKLRKESDKASKSSDKLTNKLEGVKKAAGLFKAVIASAAIASVVSFAKSLYQQNQELEKTANYLKKTTEEARAYNTVLKAMGRTAEEIKNSKALTQTYQEMEALALSMKLPEASKGVGIIKEMSDSFLKLKVIGSYACQWLYQAVQQVAFGPLRRFKDIIDELSDALKSNLPNWSNGFAKVIDVILRLASAFAKAAVDIVKFLGRIPTPIKIIGAALLALFAIIKAGPLGWVGLAITAILLLLDDFYTYLEGGDSLFGDFWGKCIEWAEKVIPVVEKVIGWIGDFLTTVWNATTSVISWLDEMGLIEPIIGGIITAFTLFKGLKLVDTIKNVVTSFKGFSSILSLLGGKTTLIILAISALVAAGIWLYKNWDVVKEKAAQIWSAIVEWVVGAWESIQSAWANVKEWFVEKFEAAKTGVKNAWAAVVDFFVGIYDGIVSAFASVGEWFSGIFTSARDGIESVWSTVTGFFSGIWESISSNPTLSGIADVIFAPFRLGWTYIETIWNTVAAFFTGIWGLITGDATLSDVLTAISQPFIDGWAKVAEIFSGVTEFFSGVWSSITSAFTGAATWFSDTFGGAWKQITGAFDGIDIGAWFQDNVWAKITGVFDGVKTWFSDMASNIWDGLTGGLSDGVEAAKEKVTGFFSNIWDGVLGFFGIHSPSTLAKEASGNIMEGFVGGAEENQESIGSRLKSVFSGIWDSAKSVWDGVTGWLGNLFGWSAKDESAKNTATSNASDAAAEVSGAVQTAFDGVDASISEPISTGCATAEESLVNLQTSAETSASAVATAFTGIDTTIGNIFVNMSTLCQRAVAQFITKTKSVPAEVKTIWTKAASYTKAAYSPIAPWIASQVSKIKSSLNSIPRKITVSVSTRGAYSEGGVVEHETHATLGEGNKREYVIPVTKPSRAIPLLKAAMEDLGITPESYSKANKMLGGSPTRNVTPTYAQNQNTTNNNVKQEINAPSTFNVYGTDAKSIATNVEIKQEQHVRNLKGAFACG